LILSTDEQPKREKEIKRAKEIEYESELWFFL